MFKVFILDDDEMFGKLVEYSLRYEPELEVHRYLSGKKMLADLHKKPSIVILDYSLSDMNGMDVFKQVNAFSNEIPVIMLSGQSNVEIAINMLRKGVRDYIIKSEEWENRLLVTVRALMKTAALKTEVEELKEALEEKYQFQHIIGVSEPMQKVFSLIKKAAQTNITICISGASGTGKELVARAVHFNSTRKKKALVSVNMGAIPKDLIESELFGHEKGSFTGALARRMGKFEEATGGTLFLDEITELDFSMQVKLLRVLQEQEITRVGGTGRIPIDARIIVATNKLLEEEVSKGRFREDLYYRLYGFPINMPLLKERGDDCLLLANHFLREFIKSNKLEKKELSPDVIRIIMSYGWPGNVRELKAVVERSAILAEGKEIGKEHFIVSNIIQQGEIELDNYTLDEIKVFMIKRLLKRYNNDIEKVADHLQIGRSTVYRLMKPEGEPADTQN
ncbi:MAG: regulator [Bacteroidetes bacterium RIFCSPLOWO2_12_FULL_37_12]|nr:MAG: regulator [Bacteroidetes bacterium RIFCSPLOWO2_12_FULL_37_12]